jgi:hypothetical protein
LIPQRRRPLDVAINDAHKPRIFDPKMDRITEGLVLVSTPTFLSAPNLKYGLQVPPKPFLAQASELSILGSERASFIGLSTSVINSLTKSFPTVFKRRDGLDVPRRQIRHHPRSPPDFSPPCSRSIVKQTRTGVPLSRYPRPMFPGRNSACRRCCIQIWDPTLATCFVPPRLYRSSDGCLLNC